jgi:hypothetical protein
MTIAQRFPSVVSVAVLVLAVVASVAVFDSLTYRRSEAEARSALNTAVVALAEARRMTDSVAAVAAGERQRGDSLAAIAQERAGVARRATRVAQTARAAYDSVVAIAPDTCDAVVAVSQDALRDAETAREGWQSAYEAETAARAAGDAAYAGLRVAYDSLRAETVRTEAAAEGLIRATAPASFLARLRANLTPKTGAGAVVGVDVTGRPTVAVGILLGWGF